MELRPVLTLPNLEDRYIWLKFEKYVLKNKSLEGQSIVNSQPWLNMYR